MARSFAHYRLFVGIAIAASTGAVSWMRPNAQPTRAITIKQTPAGFADLQRQLRAIEPDHHAVLIVMEATGTYWMRLASSLVGAGFAVSIPTDPGAPDEVYLGGPQLRGQVAFVYEPRDGLPPSDLLNGAGLLITQNEGSADPGLARKVVDTGGRVDRVTVGGVPGYWITGIAHGFWYLAPDGEVIFESGRRVGNTLAWERGGILHRIEGAITLERALQIAESMP